ncbi:MAG: hypothetical protein Aurels2KO_53980 [Aureliella sp.]
MLSPGMKTLQQIQRETATANADLEETSRHSRFNVASEYGGPERTGEETEELKNHNQEHYQRRENFRTELETAAYRTALRTQKLAVDAGVQVRGVAKLRQAEHFTLVTTLDAIETVTEYAERHRNRIRNNIKDEVLLQKDLEVSARVHQRVVENLGAMAVGPEIDLSQFDAGEVLP